MPQARRYTGHFSAVLIATIQRCSVQLCSSSLRNRTGNLGRRFKWAARATMKTLYELLGALPDDDAEDIRAAFRKAVKSAHPDINPGDPDAAIKFRQIVRANEILVDQEQRAVYD